jgi:hypothetical protein
MCYQSIALRFNTRWLVVVIHRVGINMSQNWRVCAYVTLPSDVRLGCYSPYKTEVHPISTFRYMQKWNLFPDQYRNGIFILNAMN